MKLGFHLCAYITVSMYRKEVFKVDKASKEIILILFFFIHTVKCKQGVLQMHCWKLMRPIGAQSFLFNMALLNIILQMYFIGTCF
jgi:hypothetical protein